MGVTTMPFEVCISQKQIATRVCELGKQISSDYNGKVVHLVCVLKGAYTFLADLARSIDSPVTVDFLAVSSYGRGKTRSEGVRVTKDLDLLLEGKDVIVVEDIVDSGMTLSFLLPLLQSRHPASLKTAALLSKRSRRQVEVKIDYIGFEVPDRFVVGYGLDYDQEYRQLSYVAAMD